LAVPDESLNQGVPDATPPAAAPEPHARRRESVADTVASRLPHLRRILMCPKCGSRDVRRSAGGRSLDHFIGFFGLTPFRCRSCRARFFMSTRRFGKDTIPAE
jgi:DNA-directed RNA polymerase subunit RPC12/RpoP